MKSLAFLLSLTITVISCNGNEGELVHTSVEGVFEGDVVFLSQQEINDFGRKGFSRVAGDVTIGVQNSPSLLISNLEGLQNIKSIGGNLYIHYNGAIISLKGLDNLTLIEGDLGIVSNSKITDFEGLNGLIEVTGNIFIWKNSALMNLNGLSNLVYVGKELFIGNSPILQNLDGLQNLETIGGELRISDNVTLKDFCGLQTAIGNGFDNSYVVLHNLYNPTKQDILNGNCDS